MTTLAVVGIGSLIVVALLHLLASTNPGGGRRSAALLSRPRPDPPPERPAGLVEWEALLLTASTSGPRGRARLARHLEPLVVASLSDGHGLTIDDPRAAPLLGEEWAYLHDGAPPPGRRTDDDAVIAAVTRLLDRLDALRPGGAR